MYKLLIVEDEPLIRTGLRYYFSWDELGFHKILEAENGLEGYHIAVRERPDMIITDIRMPELTGLEMIGDFGRSFRIPSLSCYPDSTSSPTPRRPSDLAMYMLTY